MLQKLFENLDATSVFILRLLTLFLLGLPRNVGNWRAESVYLWHLEGDIFRYEKSCWILVKAL